MKATVNFDSSTTSIIMANVAEDVKRQFPAATLTPTGCERYRTVPTGTWRLTVLPDGSSLEMHGGVNALLDSFLWVGHGAVATHVEVTESSVPAWVTERLISATFGGTTQDVWEARYIYIYHVQALWADAALKKLEEMV